MSKILTVATREFVETVRTRAFFLSVVLMPLMIMLGIFGTRWVGDISKSEKLPTRTLAVFDGHGELLPRFEQAVEAWNTENPNRIFAVERLADAADAVDDARRRILAGALYAYIVIPREAVDAVAPCTVARQDQQLETGRRIEQFAYESIVAVRFAASELDRARVQQLQRPVPMQTVDLQTGQKRKDDMMVRVLTPFAFMFMLVMATFGISQGLLTSVIEEKSSRVVEVLLSAISPTQLMAGKILGMVLVGLLLLTVWGFAGFYGARAQQMGHLVTGGRLVYVALYFVPGFLLSAALLAAIGSAVNELKEAQSLSFPISLLTMIPMIFWFYITEHPSSWISVALSYVPPITPFVMILRLCADPETPVWQVVTTLLTLWLAVLVAIWAAGKIFRVGVLMYGKPPSIGELIKWVQYR
ncbi:MAG: ABC transporter permease [Phycisphaerae bacterium]